MDYRQSLALCPRDLLRAIARHWGVPFNNSLGKAGIVARLAAHLADADRLAQAISALPPAAKATLEAIEEAGGQLSTWQCLSAFGPLRPYRPWASPHKPWEDNPSPLEILYYQGLVFEDGKAKVFFLPDEVKAQMGRRNRQGETAMPGDRSVVPGEAAPLMPAQSANDDLRLFPSPPPDIRLRTLLLLEAKDRGLLTALFKARDLRPYLGETLSPRLARVTRDPAVLQQRLEAHGYRVSVETALPRSGPRHRREGHTRHPFAPSPPPADLSPQDLQHLRSAVGLPSSRHPQPWRRRRVRRGGPGT